MFSRRTEWNLNPNLLTLVRREAANREVLDLTASNPTRVGLAFDDETILGALEQPEALVYDPQPKGLFSARKAIAAYYREQHDAFTVPAENLVLTTSTSEGYSHLFRLLANPEDEILVPKPSYPLFDFLADLQDVKLVPYPLIYDHGWHIDFPSLYKSVTHRTRAVVVVHPNNPTGSYVQENEISSLNSFCREYELAIVADEVFLDYAHDGADRTTFAVNGEALTFTLSGLSKICCLPQMKVAWVAVSGPDDQIAKAIARLEVIADTFLSMSAPQQLATPTWLDQRRRIQPLLLDRLRANLEELDRQLSRSSICQRLEVEGGWYALLRVPVTESDEELAIRILRTCSVLVHPGHFYDFANDGYLILSLISRVDEFRDGISRILEVVAAR